MNKLTHRLALLLATGFGLGYCPIASGTVGSLPGIVLALAANRFLSWPWQAAAALLLTVAAVPLCGIAEAHFGRKDDGRIVADEYMLFPICMIGLPATPALLAIAFVVSRACDVIKPPPARGLQKVRGGLGIVIDDFVAQLYALAINWGIWALLRTTHYV
jgi:phosphatidylglycerophosphatase A